MRPAKFVFPVVLLLSTTLYAQQDATQQSTTGATEETVDLTPWVAEMSGGVKETGADQFDEAKDSFNDAIAAVDDSEDDPRLPAAINNLAALYQRQGRYNEAEPLHLRALELREKTLGKEHPDVAQSLNNLATVYVEQRRYTEAIPLYQRAMAIWKKTRGENYYKLAAALNNLATTYEVQGQYPEAKRLYGESLGLWERNRGKDELLYAQTLENYAGLLRRMDDQAAAATATSQAKELRVKTARARAGVTN